MLQPLAWHRQYLTSLDLDNPDKYMTYNPWLFNDEMLPQKRHNGSVPQSNRHIERRVGRRRLAAQVYRIHTWAATSQPQISYTSKYFTSHMLMYTTAVERRISA